MALILPTKENISGLNSSSPGVKSSSLIIPGKTPTATALDILTRRGKIESALAEQKMYQAEASKSTARRTLEQLGVFGQEGDAPVTAKNFLAGLGQTVSEMAQSVNRSFLAGYQALNTRSLSKPFVPTGDLSKALFGEKPVSFKTIGEEVAPLVENLGISKETASKFSVPLGVFFGAMDIVPGGVGKTALKESALKIARSTDETVIRNILKSTLKAEEGMIDNLAKGLTSVDNPDEVFKILEGATAKVPTIKIPDTEDPLLSEARKYKSAEEFVKAQTYYHGSRSSELKKFTSNIPSGDEGIHLTTDKNWADKFGNKTYETYLENAKIGDKIYNSATEIPSKAQLKKQGIDAVRYLDNGNEALYVVSPNKIKITSKSQLTDIWKKAKKIPEDSLFSEARKYKTPEEFVNTKLTAEDTYTPINERHIFYHGTNKDIKQFQIRADGDLGAGAYFTPFETDAQNFAWQKSYAQGGEKKIYKVFVDYKKPLVLGKGDDGKLALDYYRENNTQAITNLAKSKGYDVVMRDMVGDQGIEIAVLDKNIIKTKSQLTDIWKKANEVDIPPSSPSYKYVQMYTSAVEEKPMTYEQASKRLSGSEQARFKSVATDINKNIEGLDNVSMKNIVGDTKSYGTENSIVEIGTIKSGLENNLRYSAAQKGMAGNQKTVLNFLEDPGGADSLYTIRHTLDNNQIRQIMDESGLEYRSLDKGTLLVYDEGSQLTKLIDDFNTKINGQLTTIKGKGEFIGGETRIAGLRHYKQIIRETEGRLSKVYPDSGLPKTTEGGIGGTRGLQKVGMFEPPRKVVTNEVKLLKDRIKNLASGARTGASFARKEVYALQDLAIKLAKDNLPVSLRGSLLTDIRNANSFNGFLKTVDKISKFIDEFNLLKETRKTLSSKQSKISWLKKIGEFNQTAIQDAKRTLGITSPIRKMNEGELNKMIEEMSKRLQFKREEGMLTKSLPSGATKAPEGFLEGFIPPERNIVEASKTGFDNLKTNLKEGARDLFGVISTQLANIDKSLKYALRRFEFETRMKTIKDAEVAESFIKKTSKMSKEELAQMDAAMKNGLIDDVKLFAQKYGFEDELEKLRNTLDDIYRRANEVGLEVEYRRNYFPRSFKNDKESVRAILEYFGKSDAKGIVETALREASAKLGRPLTDVEKVNVINTLMRGFRTSNITLSKTGALKARAIDMVTPELNQFYEDSFHSLGRYIEGTNNLIESRKFFGKHLDIKNIDPAAKLDDVIGAYVNNLIAKGKISTEQQLELSRILKARFSGMQMSPWLGAVKNIGYLSVMSSPLNAITQFGDLALAFYRAGGKAVGGVWDSTFGKGLTRKDIGVENIAAEFANKTTLARWVDKTFKLTGLDKIDRFGKETFINGTWASLQKEAAKSPDTLIERLRPIFGDETEQVIKELVSGEATDNVKYLLFNELADFQPIALSEVPLKYLEAPNGRVFYALKTYMIKLWDIYRRESFQLMRNKETRVQGIQNLVRLSALLMLFNATADELRDFVTGQKTSWQDRIFESFAKAFGFSRYTINQVGTEGIGRTAFEQILPPSQLADDISKDFKDVFIDQDEDASVANLKTIRNIPIGGKLFYWWFGKGGTPPKKKGGKIKPGSIPTITIPTTNVPTINIPTI